MIDLSLPGYKYLGPGNKIDKGKPNNLNDWVAYVHDMGYGEIIEKGGNPYIRFSDADEYAIRNFNSDDYGGVLGKAFFSIKKALYQRGLIGHVNDDMGFMGKTRGEKKRLRLEADRKRVDEQVQAGFGEMVGGKFVPYSTEEYNARQEAKRPKPNIREAAVDETGDINDIIESRAEGPAANDPGGNINMDDAGGGMDIDAGAGTGAMALMAAGGGGAPTGAEETPVDFNTRVETGMFTETKTVILPVTYYFSMTDLKRESPNLVRLRLNCPYDILVGNTFTDQTEAGLRNAGLSFDAHPAAATNPTPLVPFPTALTGSTAATAVTAGGGTVGPTDLYPAWLKWYEKAYESYHIMETDYKVTLRNPQTSGNSDVVIYHEFDAYTSSSTGNVIPATTGPFYWDTWKRIKEHKIGPKQLANGEQYTHTISGTWRPGQISHNTVNSTDIKTWYPTGAAPGAPNAIWVEQLVIALFPGINSTLATTNKAFGMNVEVEMRFKVQFKDLKVGIRYPISTDADTNFVVPDDVLQKPNTIGAWYP